MRDQRVYASTSKCGRAKWRPALTRWFSYHLTHVGLFLALYMVYTISWMLQWKPSDLFVRLLDEPKYGRHDKLTGFLNETHHQSEIEFEPKYFSWGSEGIDLNHVLRYINVSYYDNITWSKTARSYMPFPVYLVVQNNTPSLWVSSRTLKKIKGGAERRLKIMLPHFQRALRVQLARYTAQFSALSLVLTKHGSIPLLFDLSDYHECQDPNYNFGDERYNTSGGVPFFTLCRSPKCGYAFPIPTYSTYEYMKVGYVNGTNQWQERMNAWAKAYPWSNKTAQVYWRGGCKKERYEFIHTSWYKNQKGHLNVLPVFAKCGKDKAGPRVDKPHPPEKSMEFKAVFDIDGNSWSERFPRLLCYNSAVVLLSLDDDYEEYFMPKLLPGVHFIPASLDNFTKVAAMILQDGYDSILQKLVENANQWCRESLTEERLNMDFLSILNGYIEMLNKRDLHWADQWTRVAHAYVGSSHGSFLRQTSEDEAALDNLLSVSQWEPSSAR